MRKTIACQVMGGKVITVGVIGVAGSEGGREGSAWSGSVLIAKSSDISGIMDSTVDVLSAIGFEIIFLGDRELPHQYPIPVGRESVGGRMSLINTSIHTQYRKTARTFLRSIKSIIKSRIIKTPDWANMLSA
jgi:hypothetical protein